MADRVAVGRIVHGEGAKRVVVNAGERFNTDTLGMSDEDVRKLDGRGVLRRPRDESVAAPANTAGPSEAIEEAGRAPAGDDDRRGTSRRNRRPAENLDEL